MDSDRNPLQKDRDRRRRGSRLFCMIGAFILSFLPLAPLDGYGSVRLISSVTEAEGAQGNRPSGTGRYGDGSGLAVSAYNRGITLLREGKPGKAAEQFRQALSTDPFNTAAYNNLGLSLMVRGAFDAAEKAFRKGLLCAPDSIRCMNNLALLFLEKGTPRRALPLLRKAVNQAPDDTRVWINLGAALGATGNLRDSERAYLHVLALSPGDYRAHLNLARALEAEGRIGDAVVHYRAFLRFRPSPEDARAAGILSHIRELENAPPSHVGKK